MLFFVGAPLAMTATFGRYPLFPVLIGLTLCAALLLQITPGWRWRMLLRGPVLGEWRIILLLVAATVSVSVAVIFAFAPHRFLDLPQHRTGLWLAIMAFYPLLSALPQEIIYRSLFFERYGALFPSKWAAVTANGAAFALGHLFFANGVTLSMTAVGGAFMGWAYLRHRSFGLAWVLHSLAGQIIFTVGLGIFFYHGAVR
ncbi:CPBP family intramembrane metalloprotease [Pikeienuella piscinae]|uniref:CPBP family intramembrane metalloprotease n=1 Tax=Pikeienuella piscinae TaxID=2748098 RepID=A0A7L5BTB8_9RHOB|nr:CPBP family intramembrane glutamic endopeptidase [Pikeienuella piscinae]QIE54592.1 CPBP family intramembrane metalloprotease [Pikeienuella piscinae]